MHSSQDKTNQACNWTLEWYKETPPNDLSFNIVATDGDGDTTVIPTKPIDATAAEGNSADTDAIISGTAEIAAQSTYALVQQPEADDTNTLPESSDNVLLDRLDELDTLGSGELQLFGDQLEILATQVDGEQPSSEAGTTLDSLTALADENIFVGTQEDNVLSGEGEQGFFFGLGGNDYLNGGAGSDSLLGGSGNDIVVYDQNDVMVSGGTGIDFMVSNNSKLTMDDLLEGKGTSDTGPIVEGIDVLITGENAESLTNMDQLAQNYGITLDTNDQGQETLTLDMEKWSRVDGQENTYHNDAAGLTLQTNLQSVDNHTTEQEAVFIAQNTNG